MNTPKRLLPFLFMIGFYMMGFNAGLARAATVDVTIDDTGFHPSAIISIHKGDTVRWTNTGTVVHGVTNNYHYGARNGGGGFIDSDPIAPGDSFEQIFTFHGIFWIYDKYNTAAADFGVGVDDLVFISPESSTFARNQGFDLAFHSIPGFQNLSQCSISFDGAELGSCEDVFADLNFRSTYEAGVSTYMLRIPPYTLSSGIHSLSIKGVISDGQAFSDTAWYTVPQSPPLCCGPEDYFN